MNEQPFEGGTYSTYHMGLQFDIAQEGELYMIAQGAGGGYGDVLECDPELVVEDLQLDRIWNRWLATSTESRGTRRPSSSMWSRRRSFSRG